MLIIFATHKKRKKNGKATNSPSIFHRAASSVHGNIFNFSPFYFCLCLASSFFFFHLSSCNKIKSVSVFHFTIASTCLACQNVCISCRISTISLSLNLDGMRTVTGARVCAPIQPSTSANIQIVPAFKLNNENPQYYQINEHNFLWCIFSLLFAVFIKFDLHKNHIEMSIEECRNSNARFYVAAKKEREGASLQFVHYGWISYFFSKSSGVLSTMGEWWKILSFWGER